MEAVPIASARSRPEASSELLTPQSAAALLGVKVETLRNWRCTGRVTLPYLKFGKSVRYRQSDLDKFIEASVVVTGA